VKERRLQVVLGRDPIGELRDAKGIWRFTYDPAWLERADAIALSPHVPLSHEPVVDGGSDRPVQWFFDNLLPEEQLRSRMAREARTSEADAFGLLEAYGAESAGALTLLRPGETPPPGSLAPLDDVALLERIRNLPRETLAGKAPKKMSLAGAQNKLAVVIADGEIFEPRGAYASTHVLKPDHPDAAAYPHSTVNEWFTMELAARLALDVPAVSHRYVPAADWKRGHEAIYVVERFDRARTPSEVVRLHAIDGCQLLNLAREYKYAGMTLENVVAIAELTRSRAASRMRLFRWVVFNVLVANADAHLKNLSFLATAQGVELAPHYDLVSTGCFDAGADPGSWGRVPMSLKLPGAEVFGEVRASTLMVLGEALRLRPQVAARIVENLRSRVGLVADALIEAFERRPFPGRASALRAGELRVLRQIRHVVIGQMERQLAG
jgi:serine/threonine-protein kinase HipA